MQIIADELAYSRRYFAWIKTLSVEDRKTVALAKSYEQLRRNREPFYRVLPNPSADTLQSRNFKTFTTIRKWLEALGWSFEFRDSPWKRYVQFVFEVLCPDDRPDALPPVPGQIKNPIILRRFLSTPPPPDLSRCLRNDKELNRLYELIERNKI